MSAKIRKTAEQLSNELDEVQKSLDYHMGMLVALVPQDYSVVVGDVPTTRSQIKENVRNIDKALKSIKSQVRKGVRKGARKSAATDMDVDGDSSATVAVVPKRSGGLDRPHFYAKELIDFFINANLGTVDPLNPKTEKLADVLKRSTFGKRQIASSHTFSRLFSILVNANDFKDKEAGRGQFIKFPPGYLKKNLPSIYKVLEESGFDLDNIPCINLGRITLAV